MEVIEGISNPESVVSKHWKPTPLQARVLSIPYSVFERLGGGAAGGGKTDLTILEPVVKQFFEHPKYKRLVLRRTFPDLEQEIIPRSKQWYYDIGGRYNDTKKKWTFPGGAECQFGHAEREEDVRKYDSAEYNNIVWEESTHFTDFQYRYLSFSRCRSSSPDLPAYVSSYSNPGNVGHQYFKSRFVDPFPRGGRILIDAKTGMKRIFIPFMGKDNEHLLRNDPTYLARLELLPEVEKRAKLYGDWSSYEGQVFSEFRVLHLQDEPSNAVHVVQTFQIPSWWPRVIAIDWGWRAFTAVGWAAISPDGRVYFYRTYAVKQTTVRVWLADIIKLTQETEDIVDVVICHSAGQHRGEDLTIKEQVQAAFDELLKERPAEERLQVRLAERDRIGGKNLIHEYLRWAQSPLIQVRQNLTYDNELALRLLRNKGNSAYNEYLALFQEPELESNIPKLQILYSSPEGRENKEIIDVIPACVPKKADPEDVEEFDGDDFYDMLRMILSAARRYTEESRARLIQVEHEHTLQALNQPESQTQFYMELERRSLDEKSGISVRGHRRIGSGRYRS